MLLADKRSTENGLYKVKEDLKLEKLQKQANAADIIFVRKGISAKSTYKAASPTSFTNHI